MTILPLNREEGQETPAGCSVEPHRAEVMASAQYSANAIKSDDPDYLVSDTLWGVLEEITMDRKGKLPYNY